MVNVNSSRKDIRNLFGLHNVDLKRDVLDYLTELTKSMEGPERKTYISNIITNLRAEWVSVQSLDLAKFKELSLATTKKSDKKRETFLVVDMPTSEMYVYDSTTKSLTTKPRSAIRELAKFNCMQRRLMMVTESLDQNREHQKNVRPIESIFRESVCVATILGIVRRSGGAKLMAEDLTGSIPVEFTATIQDGWLPFEGGCFLLEGVQQNGIFTVDRVRLPISKFTDQLPQFAITDQFYRKNMPECGENDRMVILSDVWLDSPSIENSLNRLFTHFIPTPPNVFVFCGSFQSHRVGVAELVNSTENFGKLARILSEWSSSYSNAQFVLIPGVDDVPGSPVCPRYPLIPSVQKLFASNRNVHFATNPCTLLFKNRRILIRRDDTVDKISRSSLHISDHNINVSQSYVETIWSQRHLCPVLSSINPVVPHLDDVLLMPNNPDLLILADKCMPFVWYPDENEAGACTANPGSFGVNPNQALVYHPRDELVEVVALDPLEE